MKVVLEFRPEFSGTPILDVVTPADPSAAFIVGYVRTELGSYGVAESLRERIMEIISGTRAPTEGNTEDHWQQINAKTVSISKLFDEIPNPEPEVTDVTMPIEDFVDVLDQWIAFMKAYPYHAPVIR